MERTLRLTKSCIAFCAVLLGLSGCQPDATEIPTDIDVIFWEEQSWESGGGSQRLTLWADGRSEVMVVLGDQRPRTGTIRLRDGWRESDRGAVKSGVFPPEEAQQRFERALQAGIHRLEPVQPNYVDGGGTLVGVRRGGETRQVVIAHFADQQQGTANHRRFQALSDVLSDFDRDAYEAVD